MLFTGTLGERTKASLPLKPVLGTPLLQAQAQAGPGQWFGPREAKLCPGEAAEPRPLLDLFSQFPSALPSFGCKRGEHGEAQGVKAMDLHKKERFEGWNCTAEPGPGMTLFLLWIFSVSCRKMQLVSLTSGKRILPLTGRAETMMYGWR